MDKFIVNTNKLLREIPYSIVEDKENYFHSLFFLIMRMLGFSIEVEILIIDGRIDAVVKTKENIYVVEFKINQIADKAIQHRLRIKDMRRNTAVINDQLLYLE